MAVETRIFRLMFGLFFGGVDFMMNSCQIISDVTRVPPSPQKGSVLEGKSLYFREIELGEIRCHLASKGSIILLLGMLGGSPSRNVMCLVRDPNLCQRAPSSKRCKRPPRHPF